MSSFELAIYLLKFYIPTAFSIAFRGFGLGYSTKKRFALGFCIYTAYMIIVPAALIMSIGYGLYTHISAPVMLLASMVVLIFTTDSMGKTIFLQLVQASVTTALSVLLNMVRTVLGLSYPMLIVMLIIASPILYTVAIRNWVKPLRFIADNVHDDIRYLIALPIVTLLVVNLVPVYPLQNFANHPFFCTFMIFVIELGFFLYIYTLYRNLLKISILSKQELKNELLQAEVASYQTFLETARQNRHDLRHHDALILERLHDGDVEGAKEYLIAHDRAMKDAPIRQFCNNITANAVLRLYERRAREWDVAFSAMADIPQKMPLSPPELGGLLGNLLENALNACLQCKDTDTYIVLTAEVVDESLLLEVRNTAPSGTVFQNGLPVSQESRTGTGTRSIMYTIQNHDGIVEFSQHGTDFFVRIILPMQEKIT